MNETGLREAYIRRIPDLKRTGEWVTRVIKKELASKTSGGFKTELPVRPRVKDVGSFVAKALYRDKRYADQISEIQDQVGVRFVFLLRDQVERVRDIIHGIGEFIIDNERDPWEEAKHDPERFGYESVHCVVYPVTSFPFRGGTVLATIPCEVQVRTLLQHTFAQISHACNYKPSLTLPHHRKCKLRRVLAQGAALTDVTDCVFAEVRHEVDVYSKKISDLYECASKEYARLTRSRPIHPTVAAMLLLDSYRDDLDCISVSDLSNWIKGRLPLLSTLGVRQTGAPILSDPVILLLGCLADRNPKRFAEKWAADPAYLREVGRFFGLSLL